MRVPQPANSSFSGVSIAGMSSGFIRAIWPQAEATTLTSTPGMCRASFLLSTGRKILVIVDRDDDRPGLDGAEGKALWRE